MLKMRYNMETVNVESRLMTCMQNYFLMCMQNYGYHVDMRRFEAVDEPKLKLKFTT